MHSVTFVFSTQLLMLLSLSKGKMLKDIFSMNGSVLQVFYPNVVQINRKLMDVELCRIVQVLFDILILLTTQALLSFPKIPDIGFKPNGFDVLD